MIIYENECVSCDTCMGSHCPNRRVPHLVCDDCGIEDTEIETIYIYDSADLCLHCLVARLKDEGWIEEVRS